MPTYFEFPQFTMESLPVLAGFCLVGCLVIVALFRPLAQRRLPRNLRGYLLPDEQPLCSVRQTRLLHPLTPDTLLATDQRLLMYRPTNLGFTSMIEDYNYIDIANLRIDCGWFFCTISMKERFDGHDMTFTHIPKRGAKRFVRTVTGQLQSRQLNAPANRPLSNARAVAKPSSVAKPVQSLSR